ncbi:MAG: hypothetical protein LBK70_01760 [Clostridiales bacterium]|jgi:3-isopropylmalate dehydrogenase|nr:hypothetical protein [Clostridiales bacterium]
MNYKICLLKDDSTDPQLLQGLANILSVCQLKYKHTFELTQGLIGGAALDKTGIALPQETVDICKLSDAILIHSIGNNKHIDKFGIDQSRLSIHKLYSLLRLHTIIVALDHIGCIATSSSLKDKYTRDIKTKLVIDASRLFNNDKGYKTNTPQGMQAYDGTTITTNQISRISMLAYDLAKFGKLKLTLVDLADSSMSGLLWRQTVKKVGALYPTVQFDSMLIDDFVPQFVYNPQRFDIVIADSIVGKLLSNIANSYAPIGSIPSAVIGHRNKGIFGALGYHNTTDPNPIGIIYALSQMFEYCFGLIDIAKTIQQSLFDAIKTSKPTAIGGKCSCNKFVDKVAINLLNC